MDDIATMAGRVQSLTPRRRAVLEAMAEGLKNTDIVARLGLDRIGHVTNAVNGVLRHLGIPPDISSRTKKREMAIQAFKIYQSREPNRVHGEGAAPPKASGASGDIPRPNGEEAPSSDVDSLAMQASPVTPHGFTASGTGPGGFGVVNVMMLANPAQVIGVRTVTLDPSDEAQLDQHLSEGYVPELLADYQCLSDARICVTRVIFIKRRP